MRRFASVVGTLLLLIGPPLTGRADAAAAGITLDGTKITGAATSSGAPKIKPGAWLIDSPVGDDAAYFLVPRSVSNSTLRVGAALQPRQESAGIELSLLSVQDQRDCGSTSESASYGDWSGGLVTLAVTSRAADRDAACQSDDSLLLEVTASGTAKSPHTTRVRLVVSEEPPTKHTADLPDTAPDTQTWTSLPPTGKASSVTPGHAFSDAPELADGFHSASITPGDSQLYRVHLGWGEQVRAEVRMPKLGSSSGLSSSLTSFRVRLLGPTLADASADAKEGDGDTISGSAYLQADAEARARAMTAPVRYRNVASSADGVAGASIPGDYYLLVEAAPNAKGATPKLRYDLVTAVTGKAGSGRPEYVGGDLVIGGQSATGPGPLRLASAGVLGAAGLASLIAAAALVVRRRRLGSAG